MRQWKLRDSRRLLFLLSLKPALIGCQWTQFLNFMPHFNFKLPWHNNVKNKNKSNSTNDIFMWIIWNFNFFWKKNVGINIGQMKKVWINSVFLFLFLAKPFYYVHRQVDNSNFHFLELMNIDISWYFNMNDCWFDKMRTKGTYQLVQEDCLQQCTLHTVQNEKSQGNLIVFIFHVCVV